MSHRCTINLQTTIDPAPTLDHDRLQRLVDRCCADDDLTDVSLNVLIVDEDTSRQLHSDHFNDPTSTDVMSFPDGSDDPETGHRLLGDLAVCWPVAEREAAQRQRPATEECLLYIVHGLLHLLGYDDIDPADRAEMWSQQVTIMASEGIHIADD